jgi:hypothetical protein
MQKDNVLTIKQLYLVKGGGKKKKKVKPEAGV